MTPQVISVTEFVAIVNETLQFGFPEVLIRGEVAGWNVWQNRLVFFNLKDKDNTLSCMIPVASVKVPVEDGMDVVIKGSPRVIASGKFSFNVRSLELAGEGAIRRAFELLKQELTAEGLFLPERKRPLPPYPMRVGLITAPGSAAYADFMKIIEARWSGLTIRFAPAQVQGREAPEQIVAAIEQFNLEAEPVEVLVMIRGGGSLEDLQAFNAEAVVRAVAASRIPMLVGVGHEVDTSLADLAADLRAATPTDAAQQLVPDRRQVSLQLDQLARSLERELQTLVTNRASQVEARIGALLGFVERPRLVLSTQEAYLERYLDRDLERWLERGQARTAVGLQSLSGYLKATTNRLEQAQTVLGAIDPRAVLARGYAIARHGGKVLRNAAGLKEGEMVVIELAQDQVDSTVTRIRHGRRT